MKGFIMSNSYELSSIHKDMSLYSDQTKKSEKKLKKSIQLSIDSIKSKYPDIIIKQEKKLYKSVINEKVNKLNSQLGTYLSSQKSHIRPDGGLVYASIDNGQTFHLILVSEMKRQGTNDRNAKPQAMGNAIERSSKNYAEICLYMSNENYTPYVMFGEGCDFHENSSIIDRATSITSGRPICKTYVKNENLSRNKSATGGSVFLRKDAWSGKEMENVLIDVMDQSIRVIQENDKKNKIGRWLKSKWNKGV